jgi:hypothetical protein
MPFRGHTIQKYDRTLHGDVKAIREAAKEALVWLQPSLPSDHADALKDRERLRPD